MIENDQKGWYGAFSTIGKYSAERYHVITHKDKILNTKTQTDQIAQIADFLKRNGYHNIYGETKVKTNESLDDSQLDIIEDNIDIFQLDTNKKISKDTKKSKKQNLIRPHSAYHRTNKEAYKYHDKHMAERKKVKEETTPDCTKYVPNRDCVWKRTLVGPAWKTMKARDPMGRKDNSKFYLEHNDPLKDIEHTFIDMNKQTMRGDCITATNPRFSTARPFVPTNKKRPASAISRGSSLSYESEENIISKTNSKMIKNTISNKKSKNNSKISEKEEDEENEREDYYNLDANERINKELNDKWKRGESAKSRPTRPNTARPASVTTTFSSRPTTTNKVSSNNNNYNTSDMGLSIGGEEVLDENDLDSSSSDLNDSYEQYRYVYEKQFKKRPNTGKQVYSTTNLNLNSSSQNEMKTRAKSSKKLLSTSNLKKKKRPQTAKKKNPVYIKAVDFDKLISREYLDNIADKKQSLIPFSLPNFKQVRERPIMMVVYDRIRHKKNKPKEIQGIEPSMYSDPYINLDKINNHVSVNAPNFDRISSRPNDSNPLPSYMKKNFTREAVYSITDQSLKMNHYADGKFIKNYTSFWPKKSFNKIINLNLLNSDAFINNVVGDKKKLEKENNYIAKSMKFYNKNYEDLMKEGMLKKFDNVTYKTIRKEQKIDQKDMEKFLRNYQNISS